MHRLDKTRETRLSERLCGARMFSTRKAKKNLCQKKKGGEGGREGGSLKKNSEGEGSNLPSVTFKEEQSDFLQPLQSLSNSAGLQGPPALSERLLLPASAKTSFSSSFCLFPPGRSSLVSGCCAII